MGFSNTNDMKVLRKILTVLFLGVLLLLVTGIGYYVAVTKNMHIQAEKLTFNEKSVLIYDGTGTPVRDSAVPFLQTTKIEDIPSEVKQAFIDTEDRHFYTHHGFDYRRIVGATLKNLKARSFKEGASTISQQLIKNTHLTQEKTLKRKLQEFKLTKLLEKHYSKEEILERYLNTIYFGHSCFGITSAANFYFQKSPSELTLPEGAILAGLVKSPNNYSPFLHPDRCIKRREIVLRSMQSNGNITPQQKGAASASPLPIQAKNSGGQYARFVFEELTEIAEEKGFNIGGKIEIYTYLDEEIQNEIEDIANQADGDKSIFLLDNQSLGFKACLSTVGNIPRLPGSLIKPLLVYTPAIEENLLSPATPILDEKINYGGYAPENYDGVFHGYVSARECVERSLNIPAVKVLESLGVKKAAGYMEKMGLPIDKTDHSLALALGGMKNGFSLQQMTSAYATLANNGEYGEGRFISAVKINGETVYKRKYKKERVFSSESTYLMTDILKSTAQKGTAKKLHSLPFPIAAKTGTVGTTKGNTDAYALSYTTKDCIAVWLGNADNSKIPHTGGGLPCNLLLSINEVLLGKYQSAGITISDFSIPSTVEKVCLDKTAYYDKHSMVIADDNAPKEYAFCELFKKSAIPLNKSSSFTRPTISNPRISVTKNKVTITFDKTLPDYYSYKILRTDYATHSTETVYDGKKIEKFIEELLPNKTYSYTVIPYYKSFEGVPVSLPSISTSENPPNWKDEEILEKNWWDY